MSLWWGSDPFADLVGKATSELLPAGQEDIALNLEVCDQVRSKQVQPKNAMQIIKKRITDPNPNVVLLALGLTDICIKNGGDHFLAEVASREFMDPLTRMLGSPPVNHEVKAKALRLIQEWAQIAEAKPSQMGYMTQAYRLMKDEGFQFPARDSATVASAAFVETLTAPEWVDGDVCLRCRTSFTTFNRKHHCRNCGNVFCQQCSSHTMALPWYGIGQDVRVCDGCFNKKAPPKNLPKLTRSTSTATPMIAPSGRGGAASHHRSATIGSKPKNSKREEDDLALAIKLSLQDSGGASSSRLTSAPSEPSAQRATRQANGRMLEGTDADDDPDLAAAIAASLREYAPPPPSAPADFSDEAAYAPGAPPQSSQYQQEQQSKLPLPPSLELPPQDVDSLLSFSQALRLQEQHARQTGIEPAPNPQVQSLYDKATAARPKMARSLDEAGRRHGVLMSMHDKLTEAVRLYDRLLDAQMSRPAGAYGYQPPSAAAYDYGQPPYQQPAYKQQQPQNNYTWQPHQQQQAYVHASQPPFQPQQAPSGPQQAPAENSGGMYPSLPSAPMDSPQQASAAPYAAHHQQQSLQQQQYAPSHVSSPPASSAGPQQQYFTPPQPEGQYYAQAPSQQSAYDYNAPQQGGPHSAPSYQSQQQLQAQQGAPSDPYQGAGYAPSAASEHYPNGVTSPTVSNAPSAPYDAGSNSQASSAHRANGHADPSVVGAAPSGGEGGYYAWDAPSVPTTEPGQAEATANANSRNSAQWQKADVPALIEL
ncbi:ubiquitin binding protein [Microstroma glucosiphilum]|uniref:Vacuolar protein sorting-associated protein 27 n=1 Tax=Pseudomicrostroma glucosiphilum TaxID=1684307 RepID=A0A316UAU4_9BASI|nr:ubiquitin binding protein [Pseudomicrostroma glucosiphilum]PWN22340.1 ubiquitin binding protein [Pseudomicrostroma glucosiphilum]